MQWLPYRDAKNPAGYLLSAIERDYAEPLALRIERAAEVVAADHAAAEHAAMEQTVAEQTIPDEPVNGEVANSDDSAADSSLPHD